MPDRQAEFLFRTDPEDDRIGEFLALLNNRGWLTAKMVKQALDYSDRACRMLAEASEGQILSGQKGYKLTKQATPEEVRTATAWLESQAKKMSLRAGKIRKTFHSAA